MQTKWIPSIAVGTALITAIAVTGPAANATTQLEPVPTNAAVTFDAEEAFKAIFFMQGQAALDLYEGSDVAGLEGFEETYEVVNVPEVDEFADEVLAELTSENESYLEQFGTAVSSGDPYLVQQAVVDGRDAISNTDAAAYLQANSPGDTYVPGEMGTMCGTAVAVALFFVLAGGVFAAAGAVIWVVAAAGQAAAAFETVTAVRNVARSAGDPVFEEWIAHLTSYYAAS